MRGLEFLATYYGPAASINVGRTTLLREVPTWVSRSEGNALVSRHAADVYMETRTGAIKHIGVNAQVVERTMGLVIPAPKEFEPVEPEVDAEPEAEIEETDETPLEDGEESSELEAEDVSEFSLDDMAEEAESEDEDEESIDDIVARLAPGLSEDDADQVAALLGNANVEAADLTVFSGIGKATANKLIAAVHG